MFGTLSEEVEVKVSADKAWQVYGTLKLGDLAAKYIVDGLEVIEGDGGVGTIVKITFKPGSGISYYKEKFTTVDNERRVKEAEIIEGGYLDFGFTLYRVRFEVKDNPNDEPGSSCLMKTTIEYDVKEEDAANASLATIDPFVALMKVANEHLLCST
ncbi:S-norcoclaurine synthase 2-like [Cynara cardunculus var. scolymus]|uniref:S-norcoclaurine synthase 2-like n=1 Tax=Cynara cardunculus var. scolymus TaxID=59895 RepID=UPI000D62B6A2|nr:S-norcoclaurine synthase 2-like [Cynara cardunculus var. scolymus]